MTYQVHYIPEEWSRPWELEDYSGQERVDLGTWSWDDLQDNLTNGEHGSGWLPGHYRVEYAGDEPEEAMREGVFDIYIDAPPLKPDEDHARRAAASE